MKEKQMVFSKNPSGLSTLWKAFRSRKSSYVPGMEYPVIRAARHGFIVNERHLHAFHEICGVPMSDYLHILYPFTLAYPYIMRVLCTKEMPISMFKIVSKRSNIIMRRRIRPDERLDIDCRNIAMRIVPRGLEIDMKSEISSDGKIIWENTTTYYHPGNFGAPDEGYTTSRLEPIDGAPVIKEWYFPAKDRFRFARVSGDTNGIHYGSFYARMMGFKRDFAQPIRVVAACVSYLPAVETDGPAQLDFYLKGPVYYESTLTLKNLRTKNGNRFNLYCSGNDKPAICGIIRSV